MKNLLSEYDVIIIGSGIAGLYTAMKLNSDKHILVISKDEIINSNTNLAQGGIAVTFNSKHYESHVQDTLKTGFYHNDENRLRIMVEEGASSIDALLSWGVNFDCDEKGQLLFTKEGGHSKRRIIHYKDTTGKEIVRGLKEACEKKDNIVLANHIFACDLIVEDEKVYGVKVIEDDHMKFIYSPNVVIATGGIGELYNHTTNANVATADGIAMAYLVGAEVMDMEFVQFHPTALNLPGDARFLISEAVRGEGGILRNEKGIAFMESYHPLKDLAPRSVVSRAIFEEAQSQKNDKIFLDVTHLKADYVKNRFPNIYKECLNRGIDITRDLIPIVPVQHYMMGGIKTDAIGRTNIKGLYACGEAACTGVHGANRMASNSLLEGTVFPARVAEDINSSSRSISHCEKSNHALINHENFNEYRLKLKQIMSDHVFIFRNRHHLIVALEEVNELMNHVGDLQVSQAGYELRNMLLTAELIIQAAINREESLGSHIIEGE